MKPIEIFLPKKEKPKKRVLIHVHVDSDIHRQARRFMKLESPKLNWQELIDACLMAYVDSKKK